MSGKEYGFIPQDTRDDVHWNEKWTPGSDHDRVHHLSSPVLDKSGILLGIDAFIRTIPAELALCYHLLSVVLMRGTWLTEQKASRTLLLL